MAGNSNDIIDYNINKVQQSPAMARSDGILKKLSFKHGDGNFGKAESILYDNTF